MTTSLAEAFQGLDVSKDNHSSKPSSPKLTLSDALRKVNRIIESISEHAPEISEDSPQTRDEDDVALLRDAQEIATKSKILGDALERKIVDRVIARGSSSQSPILTKLLEHFDIEIRSIGSQIAAERNISAYDVHWKIAGKCYMEAFNPSGALHAQKYFNTVADLTFEDDFDYESDHEERLVSDSSYAEAYRENTQWNSEQQQAQWEGDTQRWLEFWLLSLNRCSGGPTLFRDIQSPEELPRYLFRAYDTDSHSFSDVITVASARCKAASAIGISDDILDLDPLSAADMLFAHLKWQHRESPNETNLVSWSSSLLFVIQYAIFRLSTSSISSEDIQIIAIDTSKFPPGQFAQDMFLINKYHDTFGLSDEAKGFFTFRLENTRYHNGEYLSQGRLNHAGRSSTFSLQDLVNAGLYQLYPEFQDEKGHSNWANRALALREEWSSVHTTTAEEFQLASQIATRCFGLNFHTLDIQILLLAFRRRKLRLHNKSSDPDDEGKRPPGPIETHRYVRLAEATFKGDGSMRFVEAQRQPGNW